MSPEVDRSSVINGWRGSRNSAAASRLCANKNSERGDVVIGVMDNEAVEGLVGLTALLTNGNVEYLYASVWVG